MKYDCMTADELELWRKRVSGGSVATIPCRDCPSWFREQERVAGRCSRERLARQVRERGPMVRYATEAERIDARRRTWRASKRRLRAAA